MFKNSLSKIFFSLALISVVILTEVLGCMHQEPLQDFKSSSYRNSVLNFSENINSHACDQSPNCSHTICHSNHFCKAELTHSKILFLLEDSKIHFSILEKIYENPYTEIFLRPPIYI